MSENPSPSGGSNPPKLLDRRLRAKTRLLLYSKRTEEADADRATKFIMYYGIRHPKEMMSPKSGR